MNNAKAFGLTQEEAEKTKDLPQTFNLGQLEVGQTAAFVIEDEFPREVTIKDQKTGDTRKDFVLNAVGSDGMTYALWLSSKSLKMEFYKLSQRHENLQGLKVKIGVREYKHETYGKVRGYTVQEDKSDALQ